MMDEAKYYEHHLSKKTLKLLASVVSPVQEAQRSKLQVDLAYVTAQQRIEAAKAECAARRQRKAEMASAKVKAAPQ